MFQIDDAFLEELGLGALPEEQRLPFRQHIFDQLEYKVGVRLSEGLTDEQLAEFEKIIDRDDAAITEWLGRVVPQYQSDELFVRMQQQLNLTPDNPGLRAEFTATKWLEVNRPDYRNVVTQTLDEIKREIIQNRDAILGAA